jgi:hypothetical protein
MAECLRHWPLLERLCVLTRDTLSVQHEELQQRLSVSPRKPIVPVRLDHLHMLAWDRLWTHDLDEWLHAPCLAYLGSDDAPLLTSLVSHTSAHLLAPPPAASPSPSQTPEGGTTGALVPRSELTKVSLRVFKSPGRTLLAWSSAAARYARVQQIGVTIESGLKRGVVDGFFFDDTTDADEPENGGNDDDDRYGGSGNRDRDAGIRADGDAFAWIGQLCRAFGTHLRELNLDVRGECEPGTLAFRWPALVDALACAAPCLRSLETLGIAVSQERRHPRLTTAAVADSIAKLGLALLPALKRFEVPSLTAMQLQIVNRALTQRLTATTRRLWST